MADFLNDLNEMQKEAVKTTEGPLLILAGAGSGKTKTLVYRIAYLISAKNVEPERILALTFTNKAAKEMIGRVEKLLAQNNRITKEQNNSSSLSSSGLTRGSSDHNEVRLDSRLRGNDNKEGGNDKDEGKGFFGSRSAPLRAGLLREVAQNDSTPNTQYSIHNTAFGRRPVMGTFHSICARILRKEIGVLGYKSSFTIYDDSDSLQAVKMAMKELQIDEKKTNPRTIRNYISSAKNELIGEKEYASLAQGFVQEIASKVYFEYQKILKNAEALDFDDLIMKTVEIFRQFPEILEKYQRQFKYIHIDEYQDTNHAQYIFSKLLAEKNKNICVVGDDWQCLPSGTLVETEEGVKKIESIERGDKVISASGYGRTHHFKVLKKKKFNFEGDLIEINTASGKKISCTPNHILFSRLNENHKCYLVYLMYRKDKGYRIGMAGGNRFDGKKHDSGLRIRANQERADKMWILRLCKSKDQAAYFENLYSYKYGIPMLVFSSYANRKMNFSQKMIDSLFADIDTKERAERLMKDLGINLDYPHFMPQATVRNGIKRINVNVVLFGDKRITRQSPWSASRLSVNSSLESDIRIFEKLGLVVRKGKLGTVRTEAHNLDYGNIEALIARAGKNLNPQKVNVFRYSFLTDKKFVFLPAGQLHPGMSLASLDRSGGIAEDRITNIKTKPYKGGVYDLDVEKVHNYIASGVAVHNSIYSWRGANFQNILDFEGDYPNAKVVKLEQNYRSTKSILDAGHSVIKRNTNRSKKELWTDNPAGMPVLIFEGKTDFEEGSFITGEIKKRAEKEGRKLSEFAVLYRTNAQSRFLEEHFLRAGIKYRIYGGFRFYERQEIKDIIAYLRFIINPNDLIALERIINIPARGIGAVSFSKIKDLFMNNFQFPISLPRRQAGNFQSNANEQSSKEEKKNIVSRHPEESKDLLKNNGGKGFFDSRSTPLRAGLLREVAQNDNLDLSQILEYLEAEKILSPKIRESFKKFIGIIIKLQESKEEELAVFIEKVMKQTGYLKFLDDGSVQGEERQENLQEFLSVAKEYEERTGSRDLAGFLEEIALISDVDNYSESAESVTLMTLHSAKGLEFPVVFMAGMEENLFPHSRSSMDASEMEEERRLCYVGITRAKERIYLTRARSRLLYGNIQSNPSSRFIDDIPAELQRSVNIFEELGAPPEEKMPVFNPGEKVLHDKFGAGIVLNVRGEEVEVVFEKIGKKVLSVLYAPIEKIN